MKLTVRLAAVAAATLLAAGCGSAGPAGQPSASPAVSPATSAPAPATSSAPGAATPTPFTYQPLFPFFAGTAGAFRVLAADFVSTEEGTGVVHVAPGFGEDDQRLSDANGIPTVVPVDATRPYRLKSAANRGSLSGTTNVP